MNRAIALGAGVLLAVVCVSCPGGGAKVGLEAPTFVLHRLGGGEMDLGKLRGKVVLVNFWATWCPECVKELPDFEKLYRRMEGKPFELLAVNVDDEEKRVREMAAEMNISFPVLLDPGGGTVARQWGAAFRLPQTFIVGPDGVLREKFLGRRDWASDEIIEKINKFIPPSK